MEDSGILDCWVAIVTGWALEKSWKDIGKDRLFERIPEGYDCALSPSQ